MVTAVDTVIRRVELNCPATIVDLAMDNYRAGTPIHAVASSKHVCSRLQHILQGHVVLVFDHVNPKDLQRAEPNIAAYIYDISMVRRFETPPGVTVTHRSD